MVPVAHDENAGLFTPLFADGRHLLTLGTLGLLAAGGFAIFLAAAGQFLPHDIQFLGMTARELCERDGCRIVHFMIHDRVSFGGTLIALSVLYFWLIHFPLRDRQPWAWWTLLISNIIGFASFLAFLGFGYLDTWHGIATLILLPCFVVGLFLTYRTLRPFPGISSVFRASTQISLTRSARCGRLLLLAMAAVMMGAGATIGFVGMTFVFVPQDLEYMHATVSSLNSLNPRLIPLIAHDRAGFGGGILIVGFLMFMCMRCGRPSRSLWQAVALAGTIGFGTAVGVHPLVGYNNPVHLAPACVGAFTFLLGIGLSAKGMLRGGARNARDGIGLSEPPVQVL